MSSIKDVDETKLIDAKLIRVLDKMKPSRYWSLWIIGAILSLAIFVKAIMPNGIEWIFKPPIAQQSDSLASSHTSSVK